MSHSSSSGFTGGISTFPTLQGLLRVHRAVPSLALDENLVVIYILDDCDICVKLFQPFLPDDGRSQGRLTLNGDAIYFEVLCPINQARVHP